jgi:hypothetical protein
VNRHRFFHGWCFVKFSNAHPRRAQGKSGKSTETPDSGRTTNCQGGAITASPRGNLAGPTSRNRIRQRDRRQGNGKGELLIQPKLRLSVVVDGAIHPDLMAGPD